MNCAKVQHYLNPLIDNELSVDLTASVMHHLDVCVSCQNEWAAHGKLHATLHHAIESIDIPPKLVERLKQQIEKKGGTSRRLTSRLRTPWLAIAAASIATLGLVTFSLISHQLQTSVAEGDLAGAPSALVADYRSTTVSADKQNPQVALHELQQRFGFMPIHPASWTLVKAEKCQIGNSPALHLAYVNDKKQTLSCYQVKHGLFDAKALHKHSMNGRIICCGQVNNVSVAYCPCEKLDNILVSSLPERDLMMIAITT